MQEVAGRNGDAERKIPAQRRAELRSLLRGRGAASIAEIAAALGVSASTVRRDLDELEREGLVRRSHGGAVSAERTTFEFRFEDRRRHNAREKASIGGYAATLLEAGQSVLFDSSTTVLCAAEALAEAPGHTRTAGITAVTNDVNVACVLAGLPGASVVVPGGEVRDGSFTLLGPYTQRFLDGLHVDVALMGMHAVSGEVLGPWDGGAAEGDRGPVAGAHELHAGVRGAGQVISDHVYEHLQASRLALSGLRSSNLMTEYRRGTGRRLAGWRRKNRLC